MLENFCNLVIYGDLNGHGLTYKIILYAYMNNIYSCRKMERAVQRDIHFIWLVAQERPDFVTINRFRYKQHLRTSGACAG